MTEQKKMSLTV